MNIKNFFEEQTRASWKKMLCVIGTIVIALVIFQAGIFVGYHKAAYSYGWGERYYKTFGERGGRSRHAMGFEHRGLSNSHGTIGKVISISPPTVIIEDQEGIEKTVTLNEGTIIMNLRNKVDADNLNIGDSVVVIGVPNAQSEIEARLVRIMPIK